jgi:uncharacterized membrane protein HdeD (DUF308 family)
MVTQANIDAGRPGFIATTLLASLANNWWVLLLRGLAALIFGVLAFTLPGATLIAVALVWGVYAAADGLLSLWAAISGKGAMAPRWWLFIVGIVGVLAGVVTFAWPVKTAFILLLFIGAWAVVTGVMQIVGAIRLRREIEGEWLLILSGALSVVFGLLMFARPAAGALATVWIIGGFAILLGLTYVALAFRLRRHKSA